MKLIEFAASRLAAAPARRRLPTMTTLAFAEIRFRQFLALTKPRVVSLIVFCAVIGMFLAVPGLPPASAVVFGTLGIALVAGAAAAINCLVEQKIDALMARTRRRPLPRGELTSLQTLVFAGVVGGARTVAALSLRECADDVADARRRSSATRSSTRCSSSRRRRRTS